MLGLIFTISIIFYINKKYLCLILTKNVFKHIWNSVSCESIARCSWSTFLPNSSTSTPAMTQQSWPPCLMISQQWIYSRRLLMRSWTSAGRWDLYSRSAVFSVFCSQKENNYGLKQQCCPPENTKKSVVTNFSSNIYSNNRFLHWT